MNITELDQYNLADAVKFHNRLNPRLWGQDEHLLPEVREKLLAIAADFQEFLGVEDLNVKDITVSGSNAAYSYTPKSDIDLHLVVDMPDDPVYQELFNAKKYQYNDEHNITIGGADVELYVQPADQKHHSLGIYSVANNDWLQVPRRKRATVDDSCVRAKVQDLDARIHNAIKSGNTESITALWDKIKNMRQAGLEHNGEFGCENLAFKVLRNTGCIGALKDAKTKAQDQELSLRELAKPKKTFRYGFGESMQSQPYSTSDGVAPTTKMFLSEEHDYENIVKEFISDTAKRLGIENLPRIYIHQDPEWSREHHSFGMYVPEKHELHVNLHNRHLLDILRTTAHELCHCRQHEIEKLGPGAGDTGSKFENEAHAVAGVIMRDFADAHPEYFAKEPVGESASGYIPKNKKEAKMPQYAMALSVDIKPGEVGRQANKLALHTGRNGEPGLLMKTTNMIGEGKIQDLNDPLGPEFKPTMPRGTVRVDVSDVYDWYKLGKHIPNLNRVPKGEFGKGPPSTIVSFGDEDTEHKYIQNLKKLGLDTTDIDPVDPNQPPGMPRQKTDPTYNVAEDTEQFGGIDISLDAEDDEVMVQAFANGRQLGSVLFVLDGEYLMPQDLEVEERFRGQGIAQTMYDFVKSKGYKIRRSGQQTDAGAGFWAKHRPEQNVWEAFDQPYPLTWERGESGVDAYTKLPDGTPLEINFSDEYDDEGNEITHVEFHRSHSQNVTGEGDAQRVFATVLAAIQQFIQDERPKRIMFGADKEPGASRAGLYKRLVDRFARPMGYQVDTREAGTFVFFDLVRRFGIREDDLVESLRREFELLEDEYLGEIRMSPSNLRQEAAKTGAIAGMEFEMIVPNANVEIEPDYEPDMGPDRRSRSFSDIEDFFFDGDYNGRGDVRRLMAELQEQFLEWADEQLYEAWENEGEDYMREYIETNGYWDDAEANEEATNALQAEYGDSLSPEEFQTMLEQLVKEKFDEFVEFQWNEQGQFYDEAREQYMDEQRGEQSEREWLDDNYSLMSDISDNFDIQWPYYYDANEDEEMDVDAVADDFSKAIGKPVNASRSYHGGRREPGHYVVEPDGSLEPDSMDDGGLEFVSPPMPIDELIDDLNKVKAWAGTYGCYTNQSTGLHINVSVPGYSLDKLDYVKLALLLGDQYILDQFGRSSNTYAKSALGKVKDLIKRNPDKGKELLDKMRGHMEDLATKAIHSGTTDKYTSINTKSGYIEFRSPGGDWLDENFDKIETTLLRFTVALAAAIDPNAYREEYLKKLYKLLEPVAEEARGIAGKGVKDTVKYFADYVAGKTPRAALRSFVKQAQLERRIKRGDVGGEEFKWEVSRPGYMASIIVHARTKEQAIDRALQPDGYPDWASARNELTAKPIGPVDTSPVRARAGEPQPVGRSSGPMLGDRPSNPDGNWVIQPENDRSVVAYRFSAADRDDAALVARQWRQANPDQVWIVQRDDNRTLGQPSQSTTASSGGNWGIWMIGAQRFANQPGEYARGAEVPLYRFPSREAAESWIEQQRATRPTMRTDIEVREIEPAAGSANTLSQTDYENRLAWPDQTGDANYEIVNRGNGRRVFVFIANTDQDAQRKYEDWLAAAGQEPDTENYGFREIVVPGSTVDLQRQRAGEPPAQAPRTLTTPGQPQQVFTGEWSVRVGGQEVTRLMGIGNVQADANRIAAGWLRQNGYGVSGEGYEVVPVMEPA